MNAGSIPSPKIAGAIDGDRVGMDFSNLGSQTSFNFQYVLTQIGNFSNISVGYNTEFTSGNSIHQRSPLCFDESRNRSFISRKAWDRDH